MACSLPKMCSLVKKWQTMIEGHVDVQTTHVYLLHLFYVGFTKKYFFKKMQQSDSEDLYAHHQQVCQIWKKMMEIMT